MLVLDFRLFHHSGNYFHEMKKRWMKGAMAIWLDTSGPAPYKRPPKNILDEDEVLKLLRKLGYCREKLKLKGSVKNGES